MSLWDEACESFMQQQREKGEDPVAIENFLQDKASLEDARQSATSLQNDSDRKYGSSDSSAKGISAKWIRRIMENLDKFLTFGDVAMTAAPESIGLAWFVVKNVLGAIQNDYKLYEIFNAGLKDITDMMVLVRTYDDIYKGHAVKASGGIFQELSKSVVEVYVSILDFSYAVRKHITGGKRSRLVHALKDTYSEAAFQQKTTDKLGIMSGELVSIQRTMREVTEFQQQSSKEQKEILNELKASRPPSHRDIAVAEYEKNMQRLTPWLEGSTGTTSILIIERENGTCAWVGDLPAYAAWLHSEASAILCVIGEPNSGKSVLGAYVCEKLRNEAGDDTQTVIQYISADTGTTDDKRGTLRFENTLLRTIYEHALDDTGDEFFLQRCNRLVLHPKQRKSQDSLGRSKQYGRSAGSQNTGGDNALDLWEASSSLIEALQKRFVLVLDAIDSFSDDEQVQLVRNLIYLKNETSIHIRILLLCHPTSQVRSHLAVENVAQISITDYNKGDIKLVIEKGLEMVPGISSAEKAEIEDVVLEKTGHQIRYVEQVALPFLRTPLRRPISEWLTELPENVNETYHRHLLQLTPDYRRLLRTALSWTLTARNPPRVEEIMEAFSGAYLNSSTNDGQNRTDGNLSLYCEQIQKAAGPFLEVRDNRLVVLGDAQAVRSFCKSEPDKPNGDLEGAICAKCKTPIDINDRFTISEKQEHLVMAITCLKHLNSASFQARHLSDHLDEARSRAGKKRTPGANDAREQTANAGAQGTYQAYNNAAAMEESKSEPEDEPTNGAGRPQDTNEPENKDADEDESVISNQDQEDMERLVDETDRYDDNGDRLRYEIIAWFYHVQEAERLWSSAERQTSLEWVNLLHEMEQFFLIETVGFEAWKLAFVPFSREKWDPVFWSAIYGLISLAELLFDKGANVMDTTPAGHSALYIASEAPNQLDVLRFFLGRGGDINFENADTIPAFHDWLCYGADAECVEEMLRNGASCSLINQKWKWNALHYFALYGTDKKVLDLLLDMPLDIEKRSNIGVRDDKGQTALHKLLSRPKIPMDILKAFLERGADVNTEDDDSGRPLYEAAYWGENEAIELIIARVSDLDDENKWGRTALHAAAFAGQDKTVDILLKHGADSNHKDKHNRTPLLFACSTGMYDSVHQKNHQATAELLVQEQIKRGATFAQINSPTKGGRTPLREAAARWSGSTIVTSEGDGSHFIRLRLMVGQK